MRTRHRSNSVDQHAVGLGLPEDVHAVEGQELLEEARVEARPPSVPQPVTSGESTE